VTADQFNALLAQLGWSISFLAYIKLGIGSRGPAVVLRSEPEADRTRRLAQAGRPTVENRPPPKEWG
jgi:hypothetical protein